MLVAIAAAERMPLPAVARAFDLTRGEILADLVLFRDLLVSRAREKNLVHVTWTPSAVEAHSWLREISFAISGQWTLLLAPRELEELRHVRFIVKHHKRQFRQSTLKGTHHV